MDILKYLIDTYSTHHPETFIITPIIFIIFLFVLSEKSLPKRIFITTLMFCLSASFFGVVWWSLNQLSIPELNIPFYGMLTILILFTIYINNEKLEFIKPNRLLYILIPLIIFSTFIRYFIPGNDYGLVWCFNRVMEFSVMFGFVKIKFLS